METTEKLFGFEHIQVVSETDSVLLFEEIEKKVEEYLLGESHDTNSTDGVFDFLTTLSEKIQKEFDELLDNDSDKKRSLRALARIFALLLNTKVKKPEKIKKYLKLPLKKPSKYGQNKINCEKIIREDS